jgi:hypothetical protein
LGIVENVLLMASFFIVAAKDASFVGMASNTIACSSAEKRYRTYK